MLGRIATAAIAIPLVVLVVGWAPHGSVALLVAALAAAGFAELRALARAHGLGCYHYLGMALSAGVAASPAWGSFSVAGAIAEQARDQANLADLALAAAVLLVLAVPVFARAPLREAMPATGTTLLGVLWLGYLSSFLVLLQQTGARGSLLFALLASVWAGDAGAMWTGKYLGRHKLAPELSPKKTVEGLIGGVLCSVAGLWLAERYLGSLFVVDLGGVHVVALGLLLAAAASVGDLIESAFKRGAGAKDSGALFPGHGGVLDRMDSLLFAAPVMYHYVMWVARA